jgi:hypothetical protein
LIDIELGTLDADRRDRLVKLLATGLERLVRAAPTRSLTPLPTVCVYDGHGDDDEAVDG